MLEKDCIQSRGFKNVEAGGAITGFQVPIRLTYYRGVWLSQLRPATVTVDGETFEGEAITWTIHGITYTQAELSAHGDVNWGLLDVATLTVRKPGGLSQGQHEVDVKFTWSASYMPPVVDELFGRLNNNKRTLILV